MTKSVFRIIILFLPTFLVLSTSARVLGAMQPPNRAMAGFQARCESKRQLCWFNIAPGATTVAQTQETMLGMGYEPSHRSSYGIITYGRVETVIPCAIQVIYGDFTAPISALRFENCNGIRMGDLSLVIGLPDRVIPNENYNLLNYATHFYLTQPSAQLSAFSPISQIELVTKDEHRDDGSVAWKGFQPQDWYCRDALAQYGSANC